LKFKKKSYWEDVYDIVRLTPEGRVSTYGAIADFLALGSARMVGWALNNCHNSEEPIPAHRVVNRKGELSGRMQFETPTAMEEQLIAEGIGIENHKVEDFNLRFWHPQELDEA
jgi:methylated-DNA-protein-cysteine methyltransferase-like protein